MHLLIQVNHIKFNYIVYSTNEILFCLYNETQRKGSVINMNKGKITLSFDDARKDTFHVFRDILLPRRLKGVVYVPSGYVEVNYNNPKDVGFNGVMSKKELDWIEDQSSFEISGHGYMHKNDFDDISKGIEKLKEWYPNFRDFGLASPRSEIHKEYVDAHEKEFRALGIQYVRGGRNFSGNVAYRRFLSLMARITKSKKLFLKCYRDSAMSVLNSYYLSAIIIHKKTTLNQVKAIVDFCINSQRWAILEFHGIDKVGSKEYEEIFCWSEEDFVKLCDYLQYQQDSGKLDVENPIEIIKSLN